MSAPTSYATTKKFLSLDNGSQNEAAFLRLILDVADAFDSNSATYTNAPRDVLARLEPFIANSFAAPYIRETLKSAIDRWDSTHR
jgi:hypothetical protein